MIDFSNLIVLPPPMDVMSLGHVNMVDIDNFLYRAVCASDSVKEAMQMGLEYGSLEAGLQDFSNTLSAAGLFLGDIGEGALRPLSIDGQLLIAVAPAASCRDKEDDYKHLHIMLGNISSRGIGSVRKYVFAPSVDTTKDNGMGMSPQDQALRDLLNSYGISLKEKHLHIHRNESLDPKLPATLFTDLLTLDHFVEFLTRRAVLVPFKTSLSDVTHHFYEYKKSLELVGPEGILLYDLSGDRAVLKSSTAPTSLVYLSPKCLEYIVSKPELSALHCRYRKEETLKGAGITATPEVPGYPQRVIGSSDGSYTVSDQLSRLQFDAGLLGPSNLESSMGPVNRRSFSLSQTLTIALSMYVRSFTHKTTAQ
jgi:hypothetical protein